MDFNGDGLPDIVRSGYPGAGAWTDPRCQQSSTAYASCLEVYFNTGQGFAAHGAADPRAAGLRRAGDRQQRQRRVRISFDVNGDGLPDWIYRRFNAVTLSFDPEWRVLLNLGGTLEPRDLRAADVPARRPTPRRSRRASGPAAPGSSGATMRPTPSSTWSTSTATACSTTSPTGVGGWTVRPARRRPAAQPAGGDGERPRRHQHRRLPAVDRLREHRRRRRSPICPSSPGWSTSTRQNDGLCTPPAGADLFSPASDQSLHRRGNELVTRYAYQDGRYDPVEREFRGFRRVVRTTSEGSTASPALRPSPSSARTRDQGPHPPGRYLRRRRHPGAPRDQLLGHAQRRQRPHADLAGAERQRATYDLRPAGVPLFAPRSAIRPTTTATSRTTTAPGSSTPTASTPTPPMPRRSRDRRSTTSRRRCGSPTPAACSSRNGSTTTAAAPTAWPPAR